MLRASVAALLTAASATVAFATLGLISAPLVVNANQLGFAEPSGVIWQAALLGGHLVLLTPALLLIYWVWLRLASWHPSGVRGLLIPSTAVALLLSLLIARSLISMDEADTGVAWPLFDQSAMFTLLLAALMIGIVGSLIASRTRRPTGACS